MSRLQIVTKQKRNCGKSRLNRMQNYTVENKCPGMFRNFIDQLYEKIVQFKREFT